ncbi:MAG: hypothetical protein IPK21_22900 [Haliscomenobacter sp.]|nr:hypothetical protein [Haliscomenobacter sp.]
MAVTVGETDIRINRGLIHGIPTEDDQQGIEISVFEKDHAEVGEVVGAQVWKPAFLPPRSAWWAPPA